jgi:site-specific recombinase XerD
MASAHTFERSIREFLAFARVEAGLAASTLEAYARDLNDLTDVTDQPHDSFFTTTRKHKLLGTALFVDYVNRQ